MLFKFPKNDSEYIWTDHSKRKMLQYRIMPQKIKTILKTHDRKEEGIAPKTVAVMKRNDTPKRKEEMWVMYQKLGDRVKGLGYRPKMKIISVWRYPGISPKGKEFYIPEDTLKEI